MGLFAAGYPNVAGPDVSLVGQLVGLVTFAALGFIPGWVVSFAMAKVGMLRISPEAEAMGMDLSELPATPYPEGIPPTIGPRIAEYGELAPVVLSTNGHTNGAVAEAPAPTA